MHSFALSLQNKQKQRHAYPWMMIYMPDNDVHVEFIEHLIRRGHHAQARCGTTDHMSKEPCARPLHGTLATNQSYT
jgi:hypothetical protein